MSIYLDNFEPWELEELARIRQRVKKDVENVRLENLRLRRLLLAARNIIPVSHDTQELLSQIDNELRVNKFVDY